MGFACVVVGGALLLAVPASAQGYPDRDCADFSSRKDAQDAVGEGDPYRLDRDGDGQGCEATSNQRWAMVAGCYLGSVGAMLFVSNMSDGAPDFGAFWFGLLVWWLPAAVVEVPGAYILPPTVAPLQLVLISGVIAFALIGLVHAFIERRSLLFRWQHAEMSS